MKDTRRPSPRDAARRGPPLWLGVAFFAVTVSLFLLLSWPTIRPRLGGTEEIAASEGSLIRVQMISQLETLSWVRRSVFPHDYYLPDTSYVDLMAMEEDSLTPNQEDHRAAGSIAWDLGLALTRAQGGFVVVTTVVVFGYDLETLTIQNNGGRTTVQLPAAEVLSVTIEDIDRTAYPYGDVPIDAEGWREISAFVRDRIGEDPRIPELAEEARTNAISALRPLIAPEGSIVEFVR